METDQSGVIVLKVQRGTPAARVGLQPRDIITTLNGSEVKSVAGLQQLVAKSIADKRWRVAIKRGDKVFNAVIE
jgi:S1-C subfamily serine protease